jgi:hypothetical protein
MKEIKLLTIKPLTGEVEYGIQADGQWLQHGIVIKSTLTDQTNLASLLTACENNAIADGYIESQA